MDSLTLYLAPWQKRMIKDFMPAASLKGRTVSEITKFILKPGIIRCPASYKIPFKGLRRGDWLLYLTDEQMVIVQGAFKSRIKIPAINVSTDFVKSGQMAFQ